MVYSLQVQHVAHGVLGHAHEHVADDAALVLGRGRLAQQRRVARAPARLAHRRAALPELRNSYY